jgi:geranylgeranyl pyrophosphate synthase
MGYVLENQTTSEYPFVFKYSFCRNERDGKKVQSLAAAIHLLQTSTLVTDDIFDSAHRRYHHPTIHRKYDVNYAFIAAELLQSIALECISSELELGKFPNRDLVLKLFQQIVKELYLGQYLDVYNSSNSRLATRDYLRVIELGAGCFFANLARCGALLANKPNVIAESLASYGYHYGMALFISDDIVDIVRKPAATGKDFATDLKGRRMRLPMILALRLSSRKDAAFLNGFLEWKNTSTAALLEASKRIRKSGAVGECRAIAKHYLDRSFESLSGLEKTLTGKSLRWLSERLFRAQGL